MHACMCVFVCFASVYSLRGMSLHMHMYIYSLFNEKAAIVHAAPPNLKHQILLLRVMHTIANVNHNTYMCYVMHVCKV